MELQDLKSYATDALTEALVYNHSGFQDVSDVVSWIEREEPDFDGDFYCPYYSQQDDVISQYEREFGDEAEDLCSGEYKASDYQKAATEYAYAIAYAGFTRYFEEAKTELTEALEEFETDAASELETEDDIKVQLSNDCPHGWAAHDRELEDGTMVWESGQLDGCNGMAREVCGVWISCCISKVVKTGDEDAA